MHLYIDRPEASDDARAYREAAVRTGLSNLTFAYRPDDGDATRRAAAIEDADVAIAQRLDDRMVDAARKLRWIAFWGAGLDGAMTPAIAARMREGLVVTNTSGVHGPNIAEHVLGMMLAFTRGFPRYFAAQRERRWTQTWSSDRDVSELTDQTLGIVGFGRIGEALALRAKPFGLRIVGTKRDAPSRHEQDATIDHLYTMDQLDDLLSESDHVVLAVPLTPATHHLIDAARLSRMKKSAYLYNIARGSVVDEPALIAALKEHRIAGAGLDVFEHEPLPPSSPLWEMDNVILTPHVAGKTPHYFTRAAALFAANLVRFNTNEPLENRFDPSRGY